jgi:hypothetical protein
MQVINATATNATIIEQHATNATATNATSVLHNGMGQLIVITHVDNSKGGTKKASDFTVYVTGNHSSPNKFQGSESGVTVISGVGRYSVSQSIIPGYITKWDNDACKGDIKTNQSITCTFTNTYTPLKSGDGTGSDNKSIGSVSSSSSISSSGVSDKPTNNQPITASTGQQCPTTNVESATLRFNKPLFISGVMPLSFVHPFHITCGHVWLSPQASNFTLIAAEYTPNGYSHSAIVPLTSTVDPRTGQMWYTAHLGTTVTGINPATGETDIVSNITTLFLSSNGISDLDANIAPISLTAVITFQ